MTLLLHELRQNRITLLVWSVALAFLLGICVLIYPEMSTQMGELSEMFANMGAFSDAFGMDSLNFGEFMGYFGVECGNTLGLGGALFAAIIGVSVLCKEEKERTADFLLTHPVPRARILTEKLCSVVLQIACLNLFVASVVTLCVTVIGESPDLGTLALLLLAYALMQIEIACVTFGISACMKRNGLGIGLGVAFLFYVLGIVSNLSDSVEWLKFLTPFGFANGAYIVEHGAIEIRYLVFGAILSALGIVAAYRVYIRKDIK